MVKRNQTERETNLKGTSHHVVAKPVWTPCRWFIRATSAFTASFVFLFGLLYPGVFLFTSSSSFRYHSPRCAGSACSGFCLLEFLMVTDFPAIILDSLSHFYRRGCFLFQLINWWLFADVMRRAAIWSCPFESVVNCRASQAYFYMARIQWKIL